MPPSFHILDEDLEKYTSERLDPARASQLRFHIAQCTTCENKLVNAVIAKLGNLGGREKREHRRNPADGSGWLQTVCPLSFDKAQVGIIDASSTGYGLRTAVPLEPGTIVELGIGAKVLVGTIRSCERLEDAAYRVGVSTARSA